jgi:(1->4)-alpha-D-glucan 1-alpha-D-glucosylmutase
LSTVTPTVAWRAAYRLQLHPGFTFADATGVLDHLASLGVSHVYLSPVLEAAAGSTHGYDVIDHGTIRHALGGREGFEALVAAAHERGLGVVLDVVPNHMAIGGHGAGNPWWWDVLEHGPDSVHARAFDIDWGVTGQRRVLMPVLDDHLRNVVLQGRLVLRREDHGALAVVIDPQRFPLSPASVAPLLARAAARIDDPVLATVARALGDAAAAGEGAGDANREALVAASAAAREHLCAEPAAAGAVDEVLAQASSDRDDLAAVLRAQHYRLARWQLANQEVRHRRFFDVTELVGLRVDDPEVFDATHRVVLGLVADGKVDGLRIDHPDGLRDPEDYLRRLTAAAPRIPVWVEKIVAPGEGLRASWPVAGTTGYDFLELVTRLLVHDDGARTLHGWFADVTGRPATLEEESAVAKREVLGTLLAADVERCVDLAARALAEEGWDASRAELRPALVELAVELPVYRTYVRPGHPTGAEDRALLRGAMDRARPRLDDVDGEVLDALLDALLDPDGETAAELAVRFQQLTAPATAKGVEDTVCYRWAPVAAQCEVGCHPDAGGVTVDAFHAEVGAAAASWPDRMLDTSTHDTKRAEDVRARMALLTEEPERWVRTASDLSARAEQVAGAAPEPALALLALQTLVGAWPVTAERFCAYLVKAAREAKTATSWVAPDDAHEDGLARWGTALVDDPGLQAAVAAEADRLTAPGLANSLAQLTLKLTCPGVPVVYQGTELWDGSLVDPDNRRPVDFALRARILGEVAAGRTEATAAGTDRPLGVEKLLVLHRLLALRGRRPEDLDGRAAYVPLAAEGPAAEHLVAYRRGQGVVVVVSRWPLRLAAGGGWGGTVLELPPAPGGGAWRDVLGGPTWQGGVAAADLLARHPVAVLEPEADGS